MTHTLPLILVSGGTSTPRDPDHFGVFLTPRDGHLLPTDRQVKWGLDNGAFSGFDPTAFLRTLRRCAGSQGCVFVACPDVVEDWRTTREQFDDWAPVILSHRLPVAVVVQDGATVKEVPWDACVSVFIGGSTAWKLGRHAADIASYAKARGHWLHMGRVNTRRRYRYSVELGCDSVDGTFFSRWPDIAAALADRWISELQAQPRFSF